MELDARLHQLAARQHGLITTVQARRLGLSSKQLRNRIERGHLDRASGLVLRITGSPPSPHQVILTAVWSSGPTAVASRATAAWLLGLDGTTCTLPPEASVLRPARGNRTLARIHETSAFEAADRTVIGGIPTTTAARTIIDIAADVTSEALERLLDSALRKRLTTTSRILWRLESLGSNGRAGTTNLLGLLGADRASQARCESWLESESLRIFARAGLPAPEVQRVERDQRGKVIRCDFAFAAGQLVVEVSGHATHATRRQRQADAERRAELALLGVVHLEFTYEDVTERPQYVTERILQFLAALPPTEVPAEGALLGRSVPEPPSVRAAGGGG